MPHQFTVVFWLAICTSLRLFGNSQKSQSVYPVSEKSAIILLNPREHSSRYFYSNIGYDLDKAISKYPMKEPDDPNKKADPD